MVNKKSPPKKKSPARKTKKSPAPKTKKPSTTKKGALAPSVGAISIPEHERHHVAQAAAPARDCLTPRKKNIWEKIFRFGV